MNNHVFSIRVLTVLFGLSLVTLATHAVGEFDSCTDAKAVRTTLNDLLITDAGDVKPLDEGIQLLCQAGEKITSLPVATTATSSWAIVNWATSMFATTADWWSRYTCEKSCCGYLDIAIVQAAKEEVSAAATAGAALDVEKTAEELNNKVDTAQVKEAETSLFRKDNDNGFLSKHCKESEPVLAFIDAFKLIDEKNTQEEQESAIKTGMKAARSAVSSTKDFLAALLKRFTSAWDNAGDDLDEMKL